MKETALIKTQAILKIVVSVFAVALSAAFLILLEDCYSSGKGNTYIYTPEGVASRLNLLLIPFILFVLLLVAQAVLSSLAPVKEVKKAKKAEYVQLVKMLKPAALEECEPEIQAKLKKVRLFKLLLLLVLAFGVAGFSTLIIVYCLTPGNLTRSGNKIEEILQVALHTGVPGFGILVLCFLYTLGREFIAKEEFILLKTKRGEKKLPDTKKQAIVLWTVRGVIAVIIVACFISGIVNGGPSDVFHKAVEICKECVGIG